MSTDALLDDEASACTSNVQLTNALSHHYGTTKIDDEAVQTMLDDYGNEYKNTQKTGTIFSSTLNLSNTIIGAGILGIPSAIKNSGYVMGILLFIVFGGIAAYTMHLTMCVALCVEYSSYDALCRATIPKFKKLTDIAVGVSCWGVMVAYLIVIGDSMDLAMEEFLRSTGKKIEIFGFETYSIWINRYFWMILFFILFIVPTISMKKMDSLKITSFFALSIFVILMILVILYWTLDEFDACHSFESDNDPVISCGDGITAFPSDWPQFLKTAPIFVMAFDCHTSLWPIRNEFKAPTVSQLTKVSLNTVVFCTTIYAVIGYAGYLTYGENVEGNILNNYPQTRLVGIIRVGLAFAIAFSYPLMSYPARECFSTLLFAKKPNKLKWYLFYATTYLSGILSIVVAIIVDDLEVILSLIGSVGGGAIVFILPGLFYYYLDHPLLKQSSYHAFKRQSSILLVVFGILLAIVGVVLQFTE